jgi:hypothetical protein
MGRSDACVATTARESALANTGIDAVALKPTEHDLGSVQDLGVSTVAVDYEGRDNLPGADELTTLAEDHEVVATTPVRADGFDPLGDDSLLREWLPDGVSRAVVAGHPAYLSESERSRAVAPRFGAAVETAGDAWVGTEGVERIALATGKTQYELLSRGVEQSIRSLRAAGFAGDVAVYAPTVLSDDEDEILDAVGEYVARRGAVAKALPDGAETDATATGRAREVLSKAARDFALVGSTATVRERVADLEDAGATEIVAYPAGGIEDFLA